MSNLEQAIHQFNRQDEEAATRQQATHYHLPYINLVGYPILPHTLALVTMEEAEQYRVIPFLHVGEKIRLAITDPTAETLTFIQNLANRTKQEVAPSLCSATSFRFGLGLYQLAAKRQQATTKVSVSKQEQSQALQSIKSKEELNQTLRKASATQILDILFSAATGMDASDIHIEPQETEVRVRFRIDGVLQDITTLQADAYKQVLSRVKFLAHMKIDVKHTSQDGRFTIELQDTSLDVRVSTLPSAFGEIIDLRLLRAQSELLTLDELNLSATALDQIKAALALPHGMMLVTGPTGSGKSTTLYAILQSLNESGVKIVTLEDPIEYRMKGIDQVQIEAESDFTFSQALRGVLRQDPDIIMVGEIRDKETADIGLQSAMTGHLFLSTLHTNNAPASLSRLIDMGVEPYKIAGAINLLIGQRLVRKLCTQCKGSGCETCHQTGFKGRLPIIEILKPSKALDDAILRKASVRELYDIALQEGMVSMYDDGMQKVAQGLTTQEEVERVTAEFQS